MTDIERLLVDLYKYCSLIDMLNKIQHDINKIMEVYLYEE